MRKKRQIDEYNAANPGKKQKKYVAPSPIPDDEIPFPIPDNWKWVRLGEICELIEDCPHSTAPDEGKGYPLIRTSNVGQGFLILDKVHRVSKSTYDKRNQRAVPQKNDLIFAREAPAGNIAVIKDELVCLGQRTVLIRPFNEYINSFYIAYFILAPNSQSRLVEDCTGTTVLHVNLSTIRPFLLPLPPLAEQARIVEKLEA